VINQKAVNPKKGGSLEKGKPTFARDTLSWVSASHFVFCRNNQVKGNSVKTGWLAGGEFLGGRKAQES
jgi:hypothetical protein